MAGDEDEAEQVVADGVVEVGVEVGHGPLECGQVASEVVVFALGDGVAAEEIGLRPLFEGGQEGLLSEVFGQADVAGEAGEDGDDAGGLDAPDDFDGAV